MPIQRLDGLPSAYDVGQGTGDFLRKAADAAANTACNIYRKHPGFVTSPGILGANDPVFQATRGLWDSLCGGRGTLPPAPSTPFLGGQCECVLYNVTFQVSTEAANGTVTTSTTTGSFRGPINGMSREPAVNDPGFFNWFVLHGTPACPPNKSGVRLRVTDATNVTIQSVSAATAGTPNCGNKPPSYQPTFPRATDTSGTTNITNNDGTNITVPFAYVPITPTANFSPQIRVDLGGLNFRFDLGGVDVNFPDLAPAPDGTPQFPGGGGSKPDCPPCPGTQPTPRPGDPQLPPAEGQPATGEEEDVPGLRFLEVIVTKLPDKVHYGEGGKNVIFAGWIAFRAKSGGYYPRQQINFQQSVFEAPEGSDGYTLTFTNGAQGRARIYTEELAT